MDSFFSPKSGRDAMATQRRSAAFGGTRPRSAPLLTCKQAGHSRPQPNQALTKSPVNIGEGVPPESAMPMIAKISAENRPADRTVARLVPRRPPRLRRAVRRLSAKARFCSRVGAARAKFSFATLAIAKDFAGLASDPRNKISRTRRLDRPRASRHVSRRPLGTRLR